MKRVLLRCQVVCLLAVSAFYAQSMVAQESPSAAKGCSNATLKGTFAEKDTGFIITGAPPAPVLPFAGVNLDTFDGKGTITAVGFATVDGNGGSQTETGTYTVNPDCTGSYQVLINPGTPGSFTAHASFVIDDDGNELQIIVTDPGTVITCIARKQFPKRGEPGSGHDSQE